MAWLGYAVEVRWQDDQKRNRKKVASGQLQIRSSAEQLVSLLQKAAAAEGRKVEYVIVEKTKGE